MCARIYERSSTGARRAGLWLGVNPVIDTEPRRVPKRIYDTLTDQELERLLPHVPAEWRGFFAVSAYAGLRKGEAAGLRKADVDLERRTLTIRGSYDRATTKGGHADTIPIAPPLLPFIEAAMDAPGSLVFPAGDGSMRTHESDPQKILRTALARANLVQHWIHSCRRCKARGKPFVEKHADDIERLCPKCGMKLWPTAVARELRFHDLRHSCATILLRAGVDIHRVQRILRHASVTTTAGTYGHLLVDDLRAGMGQAFVSNQRTTPPPIAVAAVEGGASASTDGDPWGGNRAGGFEADDQATTALLKTLVPLAQTSVTRVGLEPTTHGLKGRCSTT